MRHLNSETLAQITINLGGAPGSIFTIQGLFDIMVGLACWFIRFGIIALGVMIVVYGIMFLNTRGNPTAMVQAKKALWWGIVGGLAIMGVFTIILSIPSLLEMINGTPVSYPIMQILNNCI